MALITASGKGFLLTDGIELKFGKSGTAYARLPLVFKNSRKTPDGWVSDKEIIVEGTVFGKLAEYLTEVVETRQEIQVFGDLYIEEYEGKSRVKMNVHAAWPMKEGRPQQPAAMSSSSSRSEDFPF